MCYDPEAQLRGLYERVDVDFRDMLCWPPGTRDTDGV